MALSGFSQRSSPTTWRRWLVGCNALPQRPRAMNWLAEMVAGIHVEGPFISREPGYVGAHPAAERDRRRSTRRSSCSTPRAGW